MRLLAISTSCWTASNREFYRRLSAAGHQVTILIPSIWNFGSETAPAEPKLLSDPNIEFLEPTNFHQRLYRLKGVKAVIQKWKPEVIYFEGDPGSLMCAILGGIAKMQGAQLVALSCENLSQNPLAVIKREGVTQYLNAVLKYSLIKYSQRYIDCLFVINDDGFNYFKGLGFKKVVKTPLGFDEKVFNINNESREEIRKRLGIENDTVVVAYFGRLVYEKGIHILLESMKGINDLKTKLLIDKFSRYGNPYQEQIQSSILDSNLKNKTIFFEAEHLEIAGYMNAADITVLPSISTKKWVEQYGRVVPEAKACGSLVIVSDEGAAKDFFEHEYSFIFKTGDIKALISKIELAITTILKGAYDRKGNSEKTIEEYSMIAHIRVFTECLEKI